MSALKVKATATRPLPNALNIAPLKAALTLKILQENASYTLKGLCTQGVRKLDFIRKAITPFIQGIDADKIYCLTQAGTSPATKHTLLHLVASLQDTNSLPASYALDSVFYIDENDTPKPMPAAAQTAIKAALFELQGVRYYLSGIDEFWRTQHEEYPVSNKQFMAKVFATQLQCAAAIRFVDSSLSFVSMTLIHNLVFADNLTNINIYRLSFNGEQQEFYIPLIGAFVITRYPDRSPEAENTCVLHIPGDKIREFNSLTALKHYLVDATTTTTLPHLLSCIAVKQHSALRKLAEASALDQKHIHLQPVVFNYNFFPDQIQLLIDKQKDDFVYAWSTSYQAQVSGTVKEDTYRCATIDARLFAFFHETLHQHALPLIKAWEQSRHPEKKPAPTQLPINIYVYVHEDLSHDHDFSALYDDYFAWLLPELESLTPRKIEITFIPDKKIPGITDFNYKKGSADEALERWRVG